jgi:membrane-associated protease RseP (regulator of RpoE activity)
MPNAMDVLKPVYLLQGAILFSLPLMSILLIHEMGHYYISKKHGIRTSLPFFMPIPPIVPGFNIGTIGAVISSRDPMPNKKALFDVGIAGPIAGFLVAIPVTAIGIATSEIASAAEATSGEIVLGTSFLFMIFSDTILNMPKDSVLILSPIAFAGWVGLLITALNLLPAGQLDGGHIFRAVFGEKQKYASWAAVFIMIFTGWWFFAFIIIFMLGTLHPPPLNDDTDIDKKRKLLFIVALAMLLLCYIPFPIQYVP